MAWLLSLCHHCHLVVATGGLKQTSAITAVRSFIFLNSDILYSVFSSSVSLSWLNVLRVLFRFLVSASRKTWWVMSKLSKPTGDRSCEARKPRPSGPTRATQHTNSPVQLRAESRGHPILVSFASELSSTHTLPHLYTCKTQSVYFPVCQWHLKGWKNIPHKPNSQHIVYHSAGIFNPNIKRTVLPTSFLFFCFFWFCSVDMSIYGAQLHKDFCQLGDWKPWMKVRDNNKKTNEKGQ